MSVEDKDSLGGHRDPPKMTTVIFLERKLTAVKKIVDRGHFLCETRIVARAVQKRALETRANLIAAAESVIAEGGHEGLRIEEVVLRAGVAKGTFFAHFRDKDGLMEQLIGARMNAELDRIERLPPPKDVADLVGSLMSLVSEMTRERYVFDVILRYSGAAAVADIGPIAQALGRCGGAIGGWLVCGPFRKDVTPDLLAEGVQAFAIQAMALHFCALHQGMTIRDRLLRYLDAWLLPPTRRPRP